MLEQRTQRAAMLGIVLESIHSGIVKRLSSLQWPCLNVAA